MFQRFLSLLLILACMALIVYTDPFGLPETISPTLVLGFMLLAAYCIGFIFEHKGLPRITGYIIAGLLLGPYFLKFYSKQAVADLDFLNGLALAFIAFRAGGELKLGNIKNKLKSIFFLISGVTSVVFIGVTLVVFAISGFIPFMRQYGPIIRLAISAIFGVIAVARSPSSAIAIISETKAKGDYTDTVLSVTIAMDMVIIILFAVIISTCEVLISGRSAFSVFFILDLLLEIAIATVLGFLLGKTIIFLIEKVKVEFPVVITAMGFLVIKFSHLLGDYLEEAHEIGLHLEPLLICMAAGFTVQNFSKHGTTFLERMDRLSFPIYIGFFAITGANINVDVLKNAWFLGFVVVISRTIMIYIGSFISGKLSGDPPKIYKNTWLGFITQAGVSLGLLSEVVRRFPDIGIPIQTILIAAITINQLVGPVAFKYALFKVGETKVKRK
ncbi:MAG: cation:proton antiporter [Candidatus Aminicenantes bacterium]|nr:MAG: cation:proton antiporter [Candidatus Aminicenantes bacterium]